MIVQLCIAVTGILAVWLSQDHREQVRKYACFFGLGAQPLWLYTSYTEQQWGIFALTFVYIFAWSRGLYLHWIKKSDS